jgi:hypothetical protein
MREVESLVCSRHISLQNIHFNKTRLLIAGTNKAGRLTGRQGRSIDVSSLTANICTPATDRTKIHKTVSTHH